MTSNITSIRKLYAYNTYTSMENSKFFFPEAVKTWFELSRVMIFIYRNDLRGYKNYFELSRVRVTEGKITVNV